MAHRTIFLTDPVYEYFLRSSLREPDILRRLREETSASPHATMQIPPEQGQFMRLLVQLMGARRVLEIGVFTGYSSLSMALGLPEDGTLLACDVSEEWTGVARRYWKEAGVDRKISLRLSPAMSTLDGLIGAGEAGTFDVVFIDADKQNYPGYYERALRLLRRGGLLAVDNVLWSGRVADYAVRDNDTRVLREFNETLKRDSRVALSMIPIGDGLTLAMKLADPP